MGAKDSHAASAAETQRSDAKFPHHFEERLTKQENTLAVVVTKVDNLSNALGSFGAQLERIGNSLSASKQTNWSVLISLGGLLVAVGSLAVAPIYREAARADGRAGAMEAILRDRVLPVQVNRDELNHRLDEADERNDEQFNRVLRRIEVMEKRQWQMKK
jgi:hypothetical protein